MSLPAWAILSLGDAKQHVKAEDAADDALIERAIVAATRYVERYTGRLFVRRQVTEQHSGDMAVAGGTVLRLRWRPVVSVESVQIDGQAIADWRLDAAGARLVRPAGWPPGSSITVTYTAGHVETAEQAADEFADVCQACRLLVAHWHSRREAVAVGEVPAELQHAVTALLAPHRVVHL